MIIRTHVDISTLTSSSKKEEVKSEVIVEEVKLPMNNEVVHNKKRNKKSIPAPAVEETPVVEEEIQKTEDEDLSKWLKEHMDD